MRVKRTLPAASDWMHRPGVPGYYITRDGKYQMLLPARSQGFLICETKQDARGRVKVIARASTLEELGIPEELAVEGDNMMFEAAFAQLKSG